MSELKPCPFCGSSQIGHITKRNSIEYSCLCCDAAFIEGNPDILSTWERAAAVWNTRAPDPRISELEAETARLKAELGIAEADLTTSYISGLTATDSYQCVTCGDCQRA